MLGITLWGELEKVARACLVYPHRVMVKSGHSIGKTMIAAALTSWHYDSFCPGLTITTAPTKRDVQDLLWKEVRVQRNRAGLPSNFIGDTAPEMRTAWDHYAKGYTSGKDVSFQGRHDGKMMFIFDEAAGIKPGFWSTTKTMWKPELGHIWLAILNPTDTTTQAYLEDNARTRDGKPAWHVFELSCLDHPNIKAQLAGEEPPVPAAVSVSQVETWIADWCTPITAEEATATDFQWKGQFYRPGPQMESRGFGRWPSLGTKGVWSDALWRACTVLDGEPRVHPVPIDELPQMGCDVARHGDDNTAIVVRWGDTALSCQSVNGWAITQTSGRLIELARQWAATVVQMRKASNRDYSVEPEHIQIKVDDTGVGGGVTDILLAAGFNAVPVNAGSASMWPEKYPEKRSELWFTTAERARMGRLALGRLDKENLQRIKSQAMAPEWKQDAAGRRCVEKKEVTKEKIGRSPDEADALNLAFQDKILWEPAMVLPPPAHVPVMSDAWQQSRRPRRKLFGG